MLTLAAHLHRQVSRDDRTLAACQHSRDAETLDRRLFNSSEGAKTECTIAACPFLLPTFWPGIFSVPTLNSSTLPSLANFQIYILHHAIHPPNERCATRQPRRPWNQAIPAHHQYHQLISHATKAHQTARRRLTTHRILSSQPSTRTCAASN